MVAIAGIGFGTYGMTHGAPIGGSVLGGGTLASMVGAFLYRNRPIQQQPVPPPEQ